MAYRLSAKDPNLTKTLRRVTRTELARALRQIAAPDRANPSTVHHLRKSIKKLRALLTLLRAGFKDFHGEDTALRDAARTISALRDNTVLSATIARLQLTATPTQSGALTRLPNELRAATPPADHNDALDQCQSLLHALRKRAKHWSLHPDRPSLLFKGLARTWRRAKAAQRHAQSVPDTEAIHNWRKLVKHHIYQASFLAPIRPKSMRHHTEAGHQLAELLGDHHDLAMLANYLAHTAIDKDDQALITALIATEQSRLLALADTIATSLFADRSKALRKRWHKWWIRWRKDSHA